MPVLGHADMYTYAKFDQDIHVPCGLRVIIFTFISVINTTLGLRKQKQYHIFNNSLYFMNEKK